MPQTAENTSIIFGAIGILAGAMVGPIAGDLWRKIKGTEYATKKDCKAQHEREEKDCQAQHDREEKDCIACKGETKSSICAIQHEAAKGKKLMILIAMKVGVDKDDLKDFL